MIYDCFLVWRQAVLRGDTTNYNALVLEGAALQNLGKLSQSLESFRKAAKSCPTSLLAWQGIVSNYEKRGINNHDDLVEAYSHISRFYET
jgi:tetratricopeptide (TPR) repeat protein